MFLLKLFFVILFLLLYIDFLQQTFRAGSGEIRQIRLPLGSSLENKIIIYNPSQKL